MVKVKEGNMKGIFFIFLLSITLSACDVSPGIAYREKYTPEFVNNSEENMDVYLVFQAARDNGFLAVYHEKLTPGSSLPIWLNNYDGMGYVLGSYEFRIKESLVTRDGQCIAAIRKYRIKGDPNNSYFDTQENLDMFLDSCPVLFKFSEKDVYDILNGLPRHGGSCIFLSADKNLKAINVNEFNIEIKRNLNPNSSVRLCADPTARYPQPLY